MTHRQKSSEIFFLAGFLLIAFNLRPALSSIGPLVEFIRVDLELSGTQLGLLTTLPLLAFSLISLFTPVFTKKFGVARTLLGAMALLTFGIGLRSFFGTIGLYAGTLLLGIAIAFGNVLIPTLTKQNFSDKAGMVTGLYSSTMAIGAALAAGVSVPLAVRLNLGWRGSLAVWALFSFAAFWLWRPQVRNLKDAQTNRSFQEGLRNLSGSRLVWQMAGYMGLQSLSFYVILAWLPAILIDAGHSPAFSGWMLSMSQATGIAGSVLVPIWAGKRKNQRGMIAGLVVLELVALIGLFFPQSGMLIFWIAMLGFVLGGTFGLALLLLVLRASTAEVAAELSGIVQSIGYLIAAAGPLLIGIIYDFTQEWNYALGVLILLAGIKLLMGMGAGKAETV